MPLVREAKESAGGLKLKPGMYTVTCMNVTADYLENSVSKDKDIIRFDLMTEDVLDADGSPIVFDAIASDKLTSRAKLTTWLNAFGVMFSIGDAVDLEDCIGCKCLAKIVTKLDQTGKPTEFSKVGDLVPLVGGTVKAMGDMTVGEWWAALREAGIDFKDAREKAGELFGKEPKDLSGPEREVVFQSF